MTFKDSWKHTMSNGGVDGALYIALLSAAAGNFIPSPADAWIFYRQREDKAKWTKGEITSKQYWSRQMLWYYTAAPAWYLTLFAGVFLFGKTTKQKLMIATAVMGGGAVIGVIANNIKKDEEFASTNIKTAEVKTT
jgi:hypothetical protein